MRCEFCSVRPVWKVTNVHRDTDGRWAERKEVRATCGRHVAAALAFGSDRTLASLVELIPTAAEHHQHASHARGFRRWHDHDGLGLHLHHRRPDYVSYLTPSGGTYTHTGTPEEVLP